MVFVYVTTVTPAPTVAVTVRAARLTLLPRLSDRASIADTSQCRGPEELGDVDLRTELVRRDVSAVGNKHNRTAAKGERGTAVLREAEQLTTQLLDGRLLADLESDGRRRGSCT